VAGLVACEQKSLGKGSFNHLAYSHVTVSQIPIQMICMYRVEIFMTNFDNLCKCSQIFNWGYCFVCSDCMHSVRKCMLKVRKYYTVLVGFLLSTQPVSHRIGIWIAFNLTGCCYNFSLVSDFRHTAKNILNNSPVLELKNFNIISNRFLYKIWQFIW